MKKSSKLGPKQAKAGQVPQKSVPPSVPEDDLVAFVKLVVPEKRHAFVELLRPVFMAAGVGFPSLEAFFQRKRGSSYLDRQLDPESRYLPIWRSLKTLQPGRHEARAILHELDKTGLPPTEEQWAELIDLLANHPRAQREALLPSLLDVAAWAGIDAEPLGEWAQDQRGKHWKNTPERKAYHVVQRGLGAWDMTAKEAVEFLELRNRNILDVRISKGGGKATFHLDVDGSSEVFTVTRLKSKA